MFLPSFFSQACPQLTKDFKLGKDDGSLWLLTDDHFFLLSLAFGSWLWLAMGTQRMPGGVTFLGKAWKPCSINANCSSNKLSASVLCSFMNIARVANF